MVEFLARDRPQAAVDWIDDLEERLRTLLILPDQGRTVPEWFEPNIRQIIYRKYRIIYEVRHELVEILTLSHVRQEPEGYSGS